MFVGLTDLGPEVRRSKDGPGAKGCIEPWSWFRCMSEGCWSSSLDRQVSIRRDKAAAIIREARSQVKKIASPVVRLARMARGMAKKRPRITRQMRFQIRPARRVRMAIGLGGYGCYFYVTTTQMCFVDRYVQCILNVGVSPSSARFPCYSTTVVFRAAQNALGRQEAQGSSSASIVQL